MINAFLDLSSELTAFTRFELLGTGQAEVYLNTVTHVVGAAVLTKLLNVYGSLSTTPDSRKTQIRQLILGDEELGPIARNLIKLWYVGVWYELPYAWNESFGARANNVTFTVSPAAYTEGLIWTAIGASPPGAKAPGYGSWALEPKIPPIPNVP